MIYVGTCGYAYRDWIGAFYPHKIRSTEMLAFYARRFRAVEIDASYYGVPALRTVAAMAARTPPDFRFSFKAPGTVTHPGDVVSGRVHDDATALCASLAPLHEAGKLACVLAQFPNGFRPGDRSDAYLRAVVEAFAPLPVVVEFRHRDWQCAKTLAMLRELGAGFANVDMPALDGLLAPSSDATAPIGYIRLHGRNAALWWTGDNVTRYEYEYRAEELVPWADRAAELDAQTRETYVFFNNHAAGSAAVNAELMEALLDERYGRDAAAHVAHAAGGNPRQPGLPGFG